MRSIWLFLVVVLACSSTQNTMTDGGTMMDGPSGAACKTFTDFCQVVPLASLQTAFAAPMLTGTVTSATPDGPLGPRYVCHYQQDDATLRVNFDLSYECFTNGASSAKSNFDGRKTAIQQIGSPVEDVTGVGDEAYWQYSGSNDRLTQGNLNARSGALLLQLGGYGHSMDPNGSATSISITVAKQHAIDGLTLLVTQVR